MKTKKIWLDNLKNGTITNEMLSLCLYSVNKRAKNYRDMARKYNNYYGIEASDKKEEMYNYKSEMLQYIRPKCIHCIKSIGRIRKYSHEKGFYNIPDNDIIYQGSFLSNEYGNVDFKDVYTNFYDYYLYYQIDEFGFHQPIINEIEYPELEIVQISNLETFGKDINDLVSMQFVKKTLETLKAYANKIKIMAN